nr:hypothetical protein BACT7_18050 [Tenacibaculum mesophilum]
MKEYPRIKRLSTIGIVHHQNFDYEFNSFRTDFVGEGGAGKSMVADILQLICVGAKAFHSPTKSTGPRKPHTMVLKTDGRGTDMGYAFLNIEKAENQFVVIGIYLESSGTSNMFIIQNGNDFTTDTELMPFSRLLGVEDFQKDNTILPINELKVYLQDNLQLTCEAWDRTSSYHKILFKNKILPFDLSLNYKELENYAKIIQAFSRESLDTSKSKSLQSFLFGDEKEKELLEKFKATIEELKEDVKLFENNIEEIELLTTKQTELSGILKLKNIRGENHISFLKTSYRYYNQQLETKIKELQLKLKDYDFSLISLPLLKKSAIEKIKKIENEKELLKPEREEAFEIKNQWKSKVIKRKKIFSWMKEFDCSIDEIVERYNKYQNSKDAIFKIRILEKSLKENNLLEIFDNNKYEEKNVLIQIEDRIRELCTELETKNKLKSLNDINNKKSLANWALLSTKQFSKEQEAIIRKLQNEGVKVEKPNNTSKKYVPLPEELLDNLIFFQKEEEGFWLNQKGVLEYFSTDFIPVFNTLDKKEIKQYFEKTTKDLVKDITTLENELSKIEKLKTLFEELENPDTYVRAWNTYQELSDQLETHEMFELEKNEFDNYHKLYFEHSIEEDYEKSKILYNKLDKKWTDLDALKSNLQRTLSSYTATVYDKNIDEIKKNHDLLYEATIDSRQFLSDLNSSELNTYYPVFENLYKQEKEKYNIAATIDNMNIEIVDLRSKVNQVYSKKPELFEIPLDDTSEVLLSELDKIEKKYKSTDQDYNKEYDLFVREHLKNKKNRFEGTGDFLSLCKETLPPEILKDIAVLEEEIIEKIDKYLRDINLKNKRLNNRKLQKLATIVEEVSSEVSRQRNDIRQIHNFLNSDEKKITGGHKVSLDDGDEDTFSPGWMDLFTENINKDLGLGIDNSLFELDESEKIVSDDLEKYPALKDKLLEAFYRSGGSRKVKPEIKDLLNPKSYYNVNFSMKSKSGKRNDGSTSQTYAAISLLCIGKLSLLNRKSKNKFVEAIRFMAIDEAAGLGKNFDMLYKIAEANDYQILSMSIKPNKVDTSKQNIYLLHNSLENDNINYQPIPIFGLS